MGNVNASKPVWNYAALVEVTILRPTRNVWAYFIGSKKNIWTKSEYSTVAGEVGQVGEIYTHAHTFNGVQAFYEAVKVSPERHLVLKITHKRSAEQAGQLVGYDLLTFRESAGQTTVMFQQVLTLPVDMLEGDLRVATENQDKRVADLFQNLKAVVECD